MRPVRILLIVVALVAVAVTGWALPGGDGYRYGTSAATPIPTTQALPQAEPAAPLAPAPQDPTGPTQPAPRPRILTIGSEPVYPSDGSFWQLPPGPGLALLWADARNATKVEFLLTPTANDADDLVGPLAVDRTGRDGWWGRWSYEDRALTAHLTVRATGPGGTVERSVGVYHAAPEQQS